MLPSVYGDYERKKRKKYSLLGGEKGSFQTFDATRY